MNRAEEFIQVNTRNCSGDIIGWGNNGLPIYTPWLTPEQARKAVEIAREEIYEWLRNHIRNYAFMVTDEFEGDIDVDTAINDLKQAIKDE
jgi:hypothetical protein